MIMTESEAIKNVTAYVYSGSLWLKKCKLPGIKAQDFP